MRKIVRKVAPFDRFDNKKSKRFATSRNENRMGGKSHSNFNNSQKIGTKSNSGFGDYNSEARSTISQNQAFNNNTAQNKTFANKPIFSKESSFGGHRFSHNGGKSRPSFGGNRRNGFGGNRRRGFSNSRGRGKESNIHFSKFINKAVITEEADKFVSEHHFTDFKIDERLISNIVKKGYKDPSPIQDKIIPHVLKGEDVVGIANTGTGKTAAFLIPLINKVILNPKEEILVVVPTRELAQQIEEELKSFTLGMKIYSVCCVGGAPIGRQISMLKYWNNFVIGTPGRLKDLVNRGNLKLTPFSTIVLDEADRMLDMGFINDMKFIMSKMSQTRHTLFFSATMSCEVEGLIKTFLKNPVTISVKTRDTAKCVDQDVVRTHGKEKIDVLHELLNNPELSKVLVFGRTKHGVERLSRTLNERGFKADSIHGDKNQGARQRALGKFKDDQVKILVATDVAARGLDIPDVTHVINYDVPATYEDYVHRIGRTGRANKKGKALTFID